MHYLKKIRGFTLVELMVSLSVLGIIATMAVPSMIEYFDKRRVIEAAEDLYGAIQLARMEAISRSAPVYVRFNSTGSTWQYGVSTTATCNLALTDPTTANACVLVLDDGDGNIHGTDFDGDGTAVTDTGDLVLNRYTQAEYNNIEMTLDSMPDANNQIQFDPNRGITNGDATVTLESTQGRKLRIRVGMLGQIRLCSPAGSGNVGGYSSDGC